MVDRSVAWVSQVERGVRKVDRMSVLESLANALEIPLAELAAEAPVVAAVTEELPAARSLRLVLCGAYSLSGMLDDRRPAAIATLRGRVREACNLVHRAKYAELAELGRVLAGLVGGDDAGRADRGDDRAAEILRTCPAGRRPDQRRRQRLVLHHDQQQQQQRVRHPGPDPVRARDRPGGATTRPERASAHGTS